MDMKLLNISSILLNKFWKGETGQALHELSADLIDETKKRYTFNEWFDMNVMNRDILVNVVSEVKDNEQTS